MTEKFQNPINFFFFFDFPEVENKNSRRSSDYNINIAEEYSST